MTETQKETVVKAIKFDEPSRIPIWFVNRDEMSGDIACFGLSLESEGKNEWGYRWERLNDGTMGQPKEAVITAWDSISDFIFPQLNPAERLKGLSNFKSEAKDRYLLGNLGITGFNLYTFLRGFENSMIDFFAEPKRAGFLLDKIFGFERELIALGARHDLDGVMFFDDWGTQQGLMISPEMWREIFKARYKDHFEYAHKHGLHVWFHSCGNIFEIVNDLHEIGVDVLNIAQPNVIQTAKVGETLKGGQCFMMPISYQTVSISGSADDIKREAMRLFEELGTPKGGFIGYVEDYSCMGMSEANYQACIEAFRCCNRR